MTGSGVSVALCTYNGEAFLRAQLDSIARQDLPPDEIIICDDQSTDRTAAVVDAFASSTSVRVRWVVNGDRLGVTRNFEKAIGLCSGAIIALSDQDDVWKARKLSTIAAAFLECPDSGYVFSDATLTDDELSPIGSLWKSVRFSGSRMRGYSDGRQLDVLLQGAPFVYGNTLAFRASLRNVILPIHTGSRYFTHDTWIALLLSAYDAPGVLIDKPLVDYRQHRNQQAGGHVSWTPHAQMQRAFVDKQSYFLDYAQLLDDILRRLPAGCGDASATIKACISHLEARRSIRDTVGLARLRAVQRELYNGGYARFGSSWRSAIRDVLVG